MKNYTDLPIKYRWYYRLMGNLLSFVIGVLIFMFVLWLLSIAGGGLH